MCEAVHAAIENATCSQITPTGLIVAAGQINGLATHTHARTQVQALRRPGALQAQRSVRVAQQPEVQGLGSFHVQMQWDLDGGHVCDRLLMLDFEFMKATAMHVHRPVPTPQKARRKASCLLTMRPRRAHRTRGWSLCCRWTTAPRMKILSLSDD